jgi:hypothetical protein
MVKKQEKRSAERPCGWVITCVFQTKFAHEVRGKSFFLLSPQHTHTHLPTPPNTSSLLYLTTYYHPLPSMKDIQLFRLVGKTAVEIAVNGQTMVYSEDIEQVFPGVKHVKSGDAIVKLLRDSKENR